MAKKRARALIRKDAVTASVYNEGLVVYLYDEANTERLKELLRKHRLKNDFFSNLQARGFQETVAREALCVAYTLDQDDPISAEIAVGNPLTASELEVARWHQPQKARLVLPSGRLRIDSPNTMPLDPDPPQDRGATIQVPPGDYVLTLYRIDWSEMRRAGIQKKVPSEFLLLTPVKPGTKSEKLDGPILEFPLRQERDWIRDFKVEEREFKGKLYFYGYWEGFYVNLEKSAAKKLGLQPGSRLRIDTERLKFDALYLNHLDPEDYIAFYGKQNVEKRLQPFKEFAFGGWSRTSGRDILQFIRHKATRVVIERHLDTWIPANVTLLPERWEMPDPAQFRATRFDGKNKLTTAVVMLTDLNALLNLKKSELQTWNLRHGDLLTLTGEGETRTLVVAADKKSSQLYHFVTKKFPAQYEPSLEPVLKQGGSIFAQRSYSGSLSVHRLPDSQQTPLVGYFDHFAGKEPLLRICPIPDDGNSTPAPKWLRDELGSQPWTRLKQGSTVTVQKGTQDIKG